MSDSRLAELTALYVEDDADIRDLFTPLLKDRVRRLYVARDGEQGLAAFVRHRPDIVISDVLMPRMDGLAMSREIRRRNDSTPIILTTALNDTDCLIRAIEVGVDRYVLKPIDADRLFQALEQGAERVFADRARRLASAVLEATSDAVLVTDAEGRVVSANPAFRRITGWTAADLIGRSLESLTRRSFGDQGVLAGETGLSRQGELHLQRADGETMTAWVSVDPVRDAGGRVIHLVLLLRDITERKRAEEDIRRKAYHDALTGLPNRLLLADRLEMAVSAAQRSGGQVGVLFCDFDGFKTINDRHGHTAGDRFLQELAARLRGTVREGDTISRLGGDEFIILLPALKDVDHAEQVARRVLAVTRQPYPLDGRSVRTSCSIGMAFYPTDAAAAEDLLKAADKAMYQAKRAGGNRAVRYAAAVA